jgi:single-stranded-DNA-specific exonuclease
LLIAIDCGTASAGEIAELKNRGVDVIVLDHHEPKSQLPDCVAIVNPKLIQPRISLSLQCGDRIQALPCTVENAALAEFDLKSKLDLVALGTVADIVPLVEETVYWCSAEASKSAARHASALKS